MIEHLSQRVLCQRLFFSPLLSLVLNWMQKRREKTEARMGKQQQTCSFVLDEPMHETAMFGRSTHKKKNKDGQHSIVAPFPR